MRNICDCVVESLFIAHQYIRLIAQANRHLLDHTAKYRKLSESKMLS